MGAEATVTLEDMKNGTRAHVGNDGALRLTNGLSDLGDGGGATWSVTTNWAELIVQNELRRQIQIQNQSPTVNVFIVLANSAPSAGSGYRIAPGQTYSFPPGATWTGSIFAKGSAATGDISVLEFSDPPEED